MVKKQSSSINIILIIFLFVISGLSLVSATNHIVCLNRGQAIPSLTNPRYTCNFDQCTVCVDNNNYPVYDKNCKNNGNCQITPPTNNTGNNDPPTLTVNNPINDYIYNSKSIQINLVSNKAVSFYYSVNGKNAWTRLVANSIMYNGKLNLNEGQNQIDFKVIDDNNKEVIVTRTFKIDFTKPKISKVLPAKGFANGLFEVWFSEQNPASLILNYGNALNGRQNYNLDLSSCENSNSKYHCLVNVPIGSYDGKSIDYFFSLKDIAQNEISSKPVLLKIDTTNPVILNDNNFYTIEGKNVNFNINIDELNFQDVTYIDNSAPRPVYKKICTSLKNGYCSKKISFSPGEHLVEIKVSDNAHNSITRNLILSI